MWMYLFKCTISVAIKQNWFITPITKQYNNLKCVYKLFIFNKNVLQPSLFFSNLACVANCALYTVLLILINPVPCTFPPLEIQMQTYSPCTLTMKSLLLSIPITCWNCSESFSQASHIIAAKMSPFISTSTLTYSNMHWKHKMHIIHLSCDSCIPPPELSSSWHTWVKVPVIKWYWVTEERELTACEHLINCYL